MPPGRREGNRLCVTESSRLVGNAHNWDSASMTSDNSRVNFRIVCRTRRSRLVHFVLLTLVTTVLTGCHLYRSVRLYEEHWAQPHGVPGGLLYVALGDSAAQGIGASSPERGYVGLLAERLRETTGRPVELINISRSGAKIEEVVTIGESIAAS